MKRIEQKEITQIIKLNRKKMSVSEIAKTLNRSTGAIYDIHNFYKLKIYTKSHYESFKNKIILQLKEDIIFFKQKSKTNDFSRGRYEEARWILSKLSNQPSNIRE